MRMSNKVFYWMIFFLVVMWAAIIVIDHGAYYNTNEPGADAALVGVIVRAVVDDDDGRPHDHQEEDHPVKHLVRHAHLAQVEQGVLLDDLLPGGHVGGHHRYRPRRVLRKHQRAR